MLAYYCKQNAVSEHAELFHFVLFNLERFLINVSVHVVFKRLCS